MAVSCTFNTGSSLREKDIIIDFHPQGNFALFNKVKNELKMKNSFKTNFYFNGPEGNICPGECRTIKIYWKNVDRNNFPRVELANGEIIVFKTMDPRLIANRLREEFQKP